MKRGLLLLFIVLAVAGASFLLYRPVPEGIVLRCVSYNAGNAGHPVPTAEQIEDVVMRRGKPDIVFLQEVPWKVKIPALAERLGYTHILSGRQHPGWSNMALFSKYPLSQRQSLSLESAEKKGRGIFLFSEISINEEKILLGSVHLESLGNELREIIRKDKLHVQIRKILGILYDEAFHSNERSQSVEAILKRIAEQDTFHMIIGGDFNTVPFSRAIRMMNKRLNDSFWPSFSYFAPTHKFFKLPINPRIDYIFHSDALAVESAGVLGNTAGDHLAVYADIVLPYRVDGLGEVRGFVNKYLEGKDQP